MVCRPRHHDKPPVPGVVVADATSCSVAEGEANAVADSIERDLGILLDSACTDLSAMTTEVILQEIMPPPRLFQRQARRVGIALTS